jgi:hypothetical protein
VSALLITCLLSTSCAAQPAARPELRLEPLGTVEDALPERLGETQLVGAFAVTSPVADFGGISGASWDGDRLLLLSDRSVLFTTQPTGPGRLTLLGQRSLRSAEGGIIDSEALVALPGGDLLVADEASGRILAFAPDAGKASAAGTLIPSALRAAPENEWVEAVARLPDGSLFVLSEAAGSDDDDRIAAALRSGSGWLDLRWQAGQGFRPTDAAAVGDHLFVIERRLSFLGGWQTRVAALSLAALRAASADQVLVGREIATISGFVVGENYEALAVRTEPDGAYALTLLADDNFLELQRTLLLELRWRPGEDAAAARTKAALRPPS